MPIFISAEKRIAIWVHGFLRRVWLPSVLKLLHVTVFAKLKTFLYTTINYLFK